MKALLSIAPGGPETLVLSDLPSPVPGPGELRVRIAACGVNYPDALVIEDRYQFRPKRPFAPGSEIAGTVDAVGDGVEGWIPGDSLIATLAAGGMAEEAIVAAENAFPLPAGKDPAEAAGLIFTYGTNVHGLIDRGQLRGGETLLVLGAGGGIGLAAVEIGKLTGARVIAAVSSEAKAEAARAAGAERTLVYGRGPFDATQTRALAHAFKEAVGPDGADVIYDPVGGDYAEPALRSIAWNGRYLVVGFPAGIPRLPLNLALLKSCDVRGVFWGGFAGRDPAANRRNIEQLIDWWRDGKIRPHIDRSYGLAEGGDAISHLASRSAIGKVLVRMDI